MRYPDPFAPLDRRSFLALAGLAPLSLGCRGALSAAEPAPPEAGRRVFVQTAQARQTIEHFGASDCWTIDPVIRAWGAENRERLADLLFSRTNGIGLSLWRFNFGAGDKGTDGYSRDLWRRPESLQSAPGAPIDGSKQAGQQWFLKAAKRRGVEKTLAFTNSPPVWLTKNGRGFAEKSEPNTNLKPGAEAAFGRYLADILRYFEKQGLAFDYVSPANEPNWRWTGGQEGCSFHPDEMRRMALAVARELDAAKVKARMRLGELGDYRALLDDADYRAFLGASKPDLTFSGPRQYFKGLLADGAVRAATDDCFLGHSYWTDGSPHELAALRRRVKENFERYVPGGRFWQSEYCVMEGKRDLGMDMALRVASVIHHDLAFADATSWSWWTALSQVDYKDGLIYTDFNGLDDKTQNILPSKTLWALGNWSRFVRPGARRVEALTDALPDELMTTAYLSRDGGELIVVAVNPGGAAIPLRLETDRAVREFTPYVTDATRDLAAAKPLPADRPIAIPPRSVVTLVGRAAKTAGNAAAPQIAPMRRELPGGKYLYAVECGLPAREKAAGARRNSRADMPFGPDPGTGFAWGYVSYGRAGEHAPEKPPVRGGSGGSGGQEAPARAVRTEEGDTPGQGLAYRFEVGPDRPVTVELEWFDPWNNADRRMDVSIQGAAVEKALVVGAEYRTGRYDAAGSAQGTLEIRVARSEGNADPGADPLIARIRVRDRS